MTRNLGGIENPCVGGLDFPGYKEQCQTKRQPMQVGVVVFVFGFRSPRVRSMSGA